VCVWHKFAIVVFDPGAMLAVATCRTFSRLGVVVVRHVCVVPFVDSIQMRITMYLTECAMELFRPVVSVEVVHQKPGLTMTLNHHWREFENST
jgi:hypothetical protein